MRFVIAKPQNKMSNGDLFYTVPKDLVNCKEFEQIIASCRNRAKFELNNQIRKKLENEIKAIINTHNESAICIIKAITDYSHKLGYPVTLFGEEAGTAIMYLIGASNVHPKQINYSSFSSEYFINKLNNNEASYTLAIAKPIRAKLQSMLNNKFAHIESYNEIYKRIDLPDFDSLEHIKKLFDLTKVNCFEQKHYNNAISTLYIDIFKDMFGKDYIPNSKITLDDLSKLYAYSMCCHNHDKCISYFSDLSKYLFRDNFYDTFTELGIDNEKAILLSYRGIWKRDKTGNIKYLEKRNASPNCLSCFKEFTNIWSKATCMSRINIMLALKWYEINYPDEYVKIVKT